MSENLPKEMAGKVYIEIDPEKLSLNAALPVLMANYGNLTNGQMDFNEVIDLANTIPGVRIVYKPV